MAAVVALKCPYAKWAERDKVSCECGMLKFPSKTAADIYTDRHCCQLDGHRRCTLARALYEYYDRKSEREARQSAQTRNSGKAARTE